MRSRDTQGVSQRRCPTPPRSTLALPFRQQIINCTKHQRTEIQPSSCKYNRLTLYVWSQPPEQLTTDPSWHPGEPGHPRLSQPTWGVGSALGQPVKRKTLGAPPQRLGPRPWEERGATSRRRVWDPPLPALHPGSQTRQLTSLPPMQPRQARRHCLAQDPPASTGNLSGKKRGERAPGSTFHTPRTALAGQAARGLRLHCGSAVRCPWPRAAPRSPDPCW